MRVETKKDKNLTEIDDTPDLPKLRLRDNFAKDIQKYGRKVWNNGRRELDEKSRRKESTSRHQRKTIKA